MSKKLTEQQENDLRSVLFSPRFGLPENVIEYAFSSGKAHLLSKYLSRREDFVFATPFGSYKLPFSSIVLKSGLDNLKELLKPDVKPDADVLESKQPLKKGRGKSKKAALNRVSFTFLADSSDIERLDKLALSQDVSVAHLVRLAIKSYLKKAD